MKGESIGTLTVSSNPWAVGRQVPAMIESGMLSQNQLMYVDIGLFAAVGLSFIRMFWYQIQFIFKVLRPHRREDDIQLGPLTFLGPAKSQRMYEFMNETRSNRLTGRWAKAWWAVACVFGLLILWTGVVRDMVAA